MGSVLVVDVKMWNRIFYREQTGSSLLTLIPCKKNSIPKLGMLCTDGDDQVLHHFFASLTLKPPQPPMSPSSKSSECGQNHQKKISRKLVHCQVFGNPWSTSPGP